MADNTKKLKIYQILFAALTLAVMVTIFVFSSEDADTSSQTSSSLTKVAVTIIDKNYYNEPPAKQQEIWHQASFIVRKLAHFSIYAALGFCASIAAGRRRLFTLRSLGTVIFSFLYALSDEFHQSFSAGRSCEFRDMMIDTGGAALGLVISVAFMGIAGIIAAKRRQKDIEY